MAEKRPTILQIIPELDTGGAELSTIEIADAVQSAGGRCIVLTEGGRLVQRLRDTGAEVQFFPAAVKSPCACCGTRTASSMSFAATGSTSSTPAAARPPGARCIAARRAGVPFVTTYHGAYSEKSDAKRLYNSVMARGDAVIANSHYTSDLIRMRYGTPRSKLHVIYRGVDGRLFDPVNVAPERVAAVRPRWGVDDKQRVVLHAARLTHGRARRSSSRRPRCWRRRRRSTTPSSSSPATRSGAAPTEPRWRRRSMRPGSTTACASSATRRTWRQPSAPRTSPSSPRSSRKRSAAPRRRRR